MFDSRFRRTLWLAVFLMLMFNASVARAEDARAAAVDALAAPPKHETGLAAVYSDKLHGHRTASGKIYDRNGLTAAHKVLPFGTKIKVLNEKNRKSVILRITDRGPIQADRVLDISARAARMLGIPRKGMGTVRVEVVS